MSKKEDDFDRRAKRRLSRNGGGTYGRKGKNGHKESYVAPKPKRGAELRSTDGWISWRRHWRNSDE